jgi:tetratricopeptide (TPR) repeat protein
MDKNKSAGSSRTIILLLHLGMALIAVPAFSETGPRDPFTHRIARYVMQDNFYGAIRSSEELINREPNNPLGYFLLGTTYETISEEYRTDRFKDSVIKYLDDAISASEERKSGDPENADWHFISGASYGYRALLRAFHGNWWGAFNDGFKCSSNLNKTLELDSSFYDAYLGLGSYHYWSTIKAKDFLWLPFIADKREQGYMEIQKAVDSGYLSCYNARESFLRMYLTDKRYDDLTRLADSLSVINPNNSYCLLYHAEGLIALERFDEAAEKLSWLRVCWKRSPYFDPFGFYEAEYLSARIFAARGDKEGARRIIEKILSEKRMYDSNAYFAETFDKAVMLARTLR